MIFQPLRLHQNIVSCYSKVLCFCLVHAQPLQSCPTLCDPMDYMQPTRLLNPQDSPGKNIGVGCHFLLQGICLTQGSNPSLLCLLYCRWILYQLSYWGSSFLVGVIKPNICEHSVGGRGCSQFFIIVIGQSQC